MEETSSAKTKMKAVAILLVLYAVLLFGFDIAIVINENTPVFVTPYGECYHRKGCSTIHRNYTQFSVLEAAENGYRSCDVCDPPEPVAHGVPVEKVCSYVFTFGNILESSMKALPHLVFVAQFYIFFSPDEYALSFWTHFIFAYLFILLYPFRVCF